MRRQRALVPPDALARPRALRLWVLQRGRGEPALAVLVVVARGGGVCPAAIVGRVVYRGARRGRGAVGWGAGVLGRGGLVGREVHFLGVLVLVLLLLASFPLSWVLLDRLSTWTVDGCFTCARWGGAQIVSACPVEGWSVSTLVGSKEMFKVRSLASSYFAAGVVRWVGRKLPSYTELIVRDNRRVQSVRLPE